MGRCFILPSRGIALLHSRNPPSSPFSSASFKKLTVASWCVRREMLKYSTQGTIDDEAAIGPFDSHGVTM